MISPENGAGGDPWSHLLQRAERSRDKARAGWLAAEQQRKRLEGSRDRVSGLLADYTASVARSERQVHLMADGSNWRRFLIQLRQLADRLGTELTQAEEQCDALRGHYHAAESELRKYARLVELKRAARRDALARQENRQLDEWALRQHSARNLR